MKQSVVEAWKKYHLLAILMVMFVLILALNMHTQYTADDYIYRFFYLDSSPTLERPIINTWLIPQLQLNHYLNWNGRVVAHSIVQFFMQFNTKMIFNICNSLAYIGLILLVNKIVTTFTRKKTNSYFLMFFFIFLWFFIPSFGQTVLWLSGSGNYLWMSLIYLSFIYLNFVTTKRPWYSSVFVALLSILAGATNENSGPAAILILLGLLSYQFFQTKRIRILPSINIILAVVGFCLMISSDGSKNRGQMKRTWEAVSHQVVDVFQSSMHLYLEAYLLILIMIVILAVTKKLQRDTIVYVLIFTLGHYAAIYSMALSPDYPDRTFFGATMFIGVAAGLLFYQISDIFRITWQPIVLSVLSVLFLFSFNTNFKDISSTDHEIRQVYAQIREQKIRRKRAVEVQLLHQPKSLYNAYKGTLQLAKDPIDWGH